MKDVTRSHTGRAGIDRVNKPWLRRDLSLPEHQELASVEDPLAQLQELADDAAHARERQGRAMAPARGHHRRPR